MRTPRPQPLDLLSPTGDRAGGEPAVDAARPRAAPPGPLPREAADGRVAEAPRGGGQSQAGPAAHGTDGLGGAPSRAEDHDRRARRAGLSLPAPRSGADPRRRSLELGHHLRADE